MSYYYKISQTPVGKLKLVSSNKGLAAILWENDNPGRIRLGEMSKQNDHPILLKTEEQLKEYFKGARNKFSLALDFKGTEFQKKVWHALLTIPFGETRSYQQIADQIGHPKAFRAVGSANGKNPISIIAPCHRVIATSGKLAGFAGGLEIKTFLLDLENNHDFKRENKL